MWKNYYIFVIGGMVAIGALGLLVMKKAPVDTNDTPPAILIPDKDVVKPDTVKPEENAPAGVNIKPAPVTAPFSFPVLSSDTIVSWSWKGPYKDGGEYEVKALNSIKRLLGLLGKGEYTDYELYVSLANQYELLGDGKKTYEFLLRALAIDSEHTGLAWYNMGVLMKNLGALNTARVAFDRAYAAQPIPAYERPQ